MIAIKTTHDLTGKILLITGAGDGIGRQVAIHCAALGATVILLGRTVKKLESVYDQIMSAGVSGCGNDSPPNEPAIYPLDLQGANDVDFMELAQTIERQYQRLDGLLHNAAILGDLSPLKNYAPQQWYKVIQVNLNAVFMITHYSLPLLENSQSASVLFTSTGVAQKALPYWGAYAVSKAASDHMMKLLAAEYDQKKVRVNSFSPGVVATQMRAKAFPGERPHTLTQPSDLVPYYTYLLSDDSTNLNGRILSQDDFTLSVSRR